MVEKAHEDTINIISPDYMPDKYRWVMLALLWLLYMSFGAIVRSLSPLVTPILADLKMSYSQMGLVMGSWQLTYIGAAFTAAGYFMAALCLVIFGLSFLVEGRRAIVVGH